MTLRRAAAFGAILAAMLLPAVGAAAAPPPLTVYVGDADTRTALRLQPGFATVVRSDRRIDAVAIGDPRLVTATPVKRGQDVFDVILQPQVNAGVTNMVIWFGDVTAVWDLTIASGPRTADVVYVVLRARGTANSAAPAHGAGAPVTPTASAAPPPSAAGAGGSTEHQGVPPQNAHPDAPSGAPGPVPLLEVSQTVGPVSAVFRVSRAAGGVSIRYSVTNGGDADLAIRPAGVLVRVNGTLVPYAMARGSVNRTHPELLPHGATERGVIDAAGRTARSVQVTLSLFPASTARSASYRSAPITFEPLFTEVDRLAPP